VSAVIPPCVEVSAAVQLLAVRGESLGWLNALFAQLWPKIDEAAQKIVAEQITPQIRETLPSWLSSKFCFRRFTLGSVPPELGPIEFDRKPWGIQLGIGISLESAVDIEVFCGASAGIRSLKFAGTLQLQLGPLIGELPVVGGVVAYFLDQPKLDMDFTGVGNVADVPGLAGIVRRAIDSSIAAALVLPNVISVPLGTEEQGVALALLSQPKPMGVLRVAALSAEGLAAMDYNLFGKGTSDPYMRLRLADNEWRSSTVKKTCDPVWREDDVHDFVVFDPKQQLTVDLYDEDKLSADDHLGCAMPMQVGEVLAHSRVPLPLFTRKADFRGQSPLPRAQGSVLLRFDWLELAPCEPGPEGGVVVVEVHRLSVPLALAASAAVFARVGRAERRTPPSAARAAAPSIAEGGAAPDEVPASGGTRTLLEEVIRRCSESKLDIATTARITGLDGPAVERVLSGSAEAAAAGAAAARVPPLELHRVLYLPVSAAEARTGELEVAAVEGRGGKRVLGRATVALADVVGQPGMKLQLQELGGEGRQALRAQITVSVQGLRSSAAIAG